MNRRHFLSLTAAGLLVPEWLLDPPKGRSMVAVPELWQSTGEWEWMHGNKGFRVRRLTIHAGGGVSGVVQAFTEGRGWYDVPFGSMVTELPGGNLSVMITPSNGGAA